ncbi:MAG: hypothetical protein J2P41_09200 [Blastocatellia bacterium]|nr:hypothetical protein [Blastocatellia bacterium]
MRIEKIKIILVGCCLVSAAFQLSSFAVHGQQKMTAQQQPKEPINYEKFKHEDHLGTINVPGTNHSRVLKCDSCHERPTSAELDKVIVGTTERNRKFTLKFPGHKACVECHVTQFTQTPQQTCTICHQSEAGLVNGLSARPPQRDFPRRYDFNAFFDAKQHEKHVTYKLPNSDKLADCKFCHKDDTKPALLTIPSHPECFVCHSPGSGDEKASKKADCKSCHTESVKEVEEFSLKYISRAYGAQFTHKEHVEYVEAAGRDCYECHTISGGYNQPTPTKIRVKQHLKGGERSGRGCFSCHDGGMHLGRRVFSGEPGDNGGGSCNRCHLRIDFKVLPTSG